MTGHNMHVSTTSVVDRAVEAVRAKDHQAAIADVQDFARMSRTRFESYTVGRWLRMYDWMEKRGLSPAQSASVRHALLDAAGWSEPGPGAADFQVFERLTAELLAGLARSAPPADPEPLVEQIEECRRVFMQLHDRALDYVKSALAEVVTRFGEAAFGDCIRYVIADTTRSGDDPETMLTYVVEGMVGHLSGPDRRGRVDIADSGDRWELTFAPCGSGGLSFTSGSTAGGVDDDASNGESDMLRSAFPWTWNKTGVCHYCVHCAIGMQIVPIERTGSPLVAIDPPTWDFEANRPAKSSCTFNIYKRSEDIPDSVFRDVGLTDRGPGRR